MGRLAKGVFLVLALVAIGAALHWSTINGRGSAALSRFIPKSPQRNVPTGPTPRFDGTIPAATAAARSPESGPSAPVVAAGAAVTIRLSEAPATWYLRGEEGGNERFYRQLLRKEAGDDAVLSSDLGRAAREFVFQYTELGREPPSDVREFLIRSSGAIAGDTAFRHVRTTSDATKALQSAIKSVVADPPNGSGVLFIGIGEVFTPGAKYKRHIGVVATRLPVVVDPAPRTVKPGETWQLSGRILGRYRGLSALILREDGSTEAKLPHLEADRFAIDVIAGNKPGWIDVQLVGTGPNGPGKLFQARVEVGRAVPEEWFAQLPPDEARVSDAEGAAALAFQLLNADRKRHGLAALRWDDALAEVAADHSRDMRDNDFFAHLSPRTGLHTDRLRRAGYRSVASAENLAHNVSVSEAERGLMASLGHRRNILSKENTHVGLGVVGEELQDGSKRWWITQMFARPAKVVDPDEVRLRLAEVIDRERKKAGLPGLKLDADLSDVARDGAQTVAGGGLQGASQQMLDDAKSRRLLRGRLRAWAASTPEIERVQLPSLVREPSARRIGIGVVPAGGDDVRIGIALLVAD